MHPISFSGSCNSNCFSRNESGRDELTGFDSQKSITPTPISSSAIISDTLLSPSAQCLLAMEPSQEESTLNSSSKHDNRKRLSKLITPGMHQTRCRATLLILIAFTLLTPACRNAQTEKEATAPPPTSFVAPVPIVTELDSDMFPEFWLAPSINASATPVDEQHLDRGIAQIHKGMKKYPPDVLKANLERVYVVGELGFSGIFAGGTYS